MPGAYRRKGQRGGNYTIWWTGEKGERCFATGVATRADSLKIAQFNETQARLVREGMLEPGERKRREASKRPVSEHAEDYRGALLDTGDTKEHARHTANAVKRLLADAAVTSVGDLAPDQIRAALGRLKAIRSARTCNHALAALKGFARWLHHSGRVKEVPPGLLALKPYNEDVDRKLVRRPATKDEVARLLAAAESGKTLLACYGKTKSKHHAEYITGPERAIIYRIALGTGFRADEIRTLTPGRFRLEGDSPAVRVLAGYAKNRKETDQPITRELAAALKPFVDGKPIDQPFLRVPVRTAEMLRHDLTAAGIPDKDAAGEVLDFHALRGTFITDLIMRGVDPKTVQELARHSTITLTIDRYTRTSDERKRKAIEGEK